MLAGDIARQLTTFIRESFLDGDAGEELSETAPLLEWGVLNSMNIAILLNHIRDELGIQVPPGMINQGNFKSIESLTAMIVELSGHGMVSDPAAGQAGTA